MYTVYSYVHINIGYGYYEYTSTTRETDWRMKFGNIAGRVEWEAEDRVHFFFNKFKLRSIKNNDTLQTHKNKKSA